MAAQSERTSPVPLLRRSTVAAAVAALAVSASVALGVAPASAEEAVGYDLDLILESDVAAPGQPVGYVVLLTDLDGEPIDPQPDFEYFVGSDATDQVVDETTVTLPREGDWAVIARADYEGKEIVDVEGLRIVAPAPVASLTITPSATTVPVGGSVDLVIDAKDASGEPVDASGATITSSVPTDVIDGLTVTFPSASPHVLTATLDGVSASVTIEVTAAATPAGSSGAGASSGGARLAETGFDSAPLTAALALLLVGGVAIAVAARRRAAQR